MLKGTFRQSLCIMFTENIPIHLFIPDLFVQPYYLSGPLPLNPVCAEYFCGKNRYAFVFDIIPPEWNGIGKWNLFSWKTNIYLSYTVKIVAADDLVMAEAMNFMTPVFQGSADGQGVMTTEYALLWPGQFTRVSKHLPPLNNDYCGMRDR